MLYQLSFASVFCNPIKLNYIGPPETNIFDVDASDTLKVGQAQTNLNVVIQVFFEAIDASNNTLIHPTRLTAGPSYKCAHVGHNEVTHLLNPPNTVGRSSAWNP